MKRTRDKIHPDGMLRVCTHCAFIYRSHAKGNIFQICPKCKRPLFVDELLQETKTMLRAAAQRLEAAKVMATAVYEFDDFAYNNDDDTWDGVAIDPVASLTLMRIFADDIRRQLERMDLLDDIYMKDKVDLEYLESELKKNLASIKAKRAERDAAQAATNDV